MTDIKEIKRVSEGDLIALYTWMCDENFTSVTLEELKEWFTLYPDSFIGAYNDQGELLGHIFNRCLNEKTALVEMVIARADTRGKGIGKRLLQYAVQRNPAHNSVLVSVNSAEAFYVKQGFKRMELKLIRQYDMKPIVSGSGDSEGANIGVKMVRFNHNDDLVDLVVKYDFAIHGQDRKALLKLNSNNDCCYCLCAKNATSDEIVGYITLKKTKVKYKVVAFCADSPDIASALLQKSFEFYSESSLGLCVAFPSPNHSNATRIYDKLLHSPADKTIGYETFLSTSGSIEDQIEWEKIYSVGELGYMGFV